jgi:hypothetical protein
MAFEHTILMGEMDQNDFLRFQYLWTINP